MTDRGEKIDGVKKIYLPFNLSQLVRTIQSILIFKIQNFITKFSKISTLITSLLCLYMKIHTIYYL